MVWMLLHGFAIIVANVFFNTLLMLYGAVLTCLTRIDVIMHVFLRDRKLPKASAIRPHNVARNFTIYIRTQSKLAAVNR